LFNDPDQAVREDSVRALGEIGDPRAVEFLLHVITEPGIRPLAVEALGAIGARRALPTLIAIASGTAQPAESRVIAGCGDRWTEEMLAMTAAVRALGQIRDEEAIPALVAALDNTVTRAESAMALVHLGRPAIAPLLAVLRDTKDENIRYHAREALTSLGWRPGRV
jgi:HEAT repeat protein